MSQFSNKDDDKYDAKAIKKPRVFSENSRAETDMYDFVQHCMLSLGKRLVDSKIYVA